MLERTRQRSKRNLLFSALFIAFSAIAGVMAFTQLTFGTPARMGPGFFPVVIASIMAVLSAVAAFLPEDEHAPPLRLTSLHTTSIILACPVVFAFTISPLGLVISLALTIFLSSFASRKTTLVQSFILTISITAFCVVVFHYLLDLPIPLWGSMLRSLV